MTNSIMGVGDPEAGLGEGDEPLTIGNSEINSALIGIITSTFKVLSTSSANGVLIINSISGFVGHALQTTVQITDGADNVLLSIYPIYGGFTAFTSTYLPFTIIGPLRVVNSSGSAPANGYKVRITPAPTNASIFIDYTFR